MDIVSLGEKPTKTFDGQSSPPEPMNVFNKSFVDNKTLSNEKQVESNAATDRMRLANESFNTISVKVPNAQNIDHKASLLLTTKTSDEPLTSELKKGSGVAKQSQESSPMPKGAGNTLGF